MHSYSKKNENWSVKEISVQGQRGASFSTTVYLSSSRLSADAKETPDCQE